MRVLVTGSAGFIGGALVRALAVRGDAVAGFDRRRSEAPQGVPVYCADLLDAAAVADAVESFAPEIVLHLAARTDLDETKNLSGYAANIDGVRNLLAAVAKTPSVRRCLWTSSQLVCRPGHVPRDETDTSPHTLYGESKVLTERIVREQDGGGKDWAIVRPTTVWGPGMSPHYQRFLSMIRRGFYFHVGSRPLWKSYSYIGNIVHQYIALAQAPADAIHRKTFYLADYAPIDLRAWCMAFQNAFGARRIPTLPVPAARALAAIGDAAGAAGLRRVPFNSFRLNNILTEYVFDLEPTAAVCGPLPYSMAEGVSETAAWFSSLAEAAEGRESALRQAASDRRN